jgi:transposase-like protein
MANRQRDLAKEDFWRQAVARRERSGLSVQEFCGREGLSEASFYSWRRELARRERATCSSQATFLPIQVTPQVSTAIEIVLAEGIVVRVRPGFDRHTLGQVVALLAGGSSC